MLKLMEFITFSTSLTSPLLGVGVTVNYSHLSNGVKSLHLSRSHFETLIQAVGSMSYSPDAMVLQIQANILSLRFLYIKNPGCVWQRLCKDPGSGGSSWIQLLHPGPLCRFSRDCYLWNPHHYAEDFHTAWKPCAYKVKKFLFQSVSGLRASPLIWEFLLRTAFHSSRCCQRVLGWSCLRTWLP